MRFGVISPTYLVFFILVVIALCVTGGIIIMYYSKSGQRRREELQRAQWRRQLVAAALLRHWARERHQLGISWPDSEPSREPQLLRESVPMPPELVEALPIITYGQEPRWAAGDRRLDAGVAGGCEAGCEPGEAAAAAAAGLMVYTSEVCAICVDRFERGAQLRLLPCAHAFHAECIGAWLQRDHTCPLCKHDLLLGASKGGVPTSAAAALTAPPADGVPAAGPLLPPVPWQAPPLACVDSSDIAIVIQEPRPATGVQLASLHLPLPAGAAPAACSQPPICPS